MTVYSTDPQQVLRTIRDTLVERVAPDVTGGTARLELAGVVEALDNLVTRLAWDRDGLARSVDRTEELAGALGLDPAGSDEVDVTSLRRRRSEVADTLSATYRSGANGDEIVSAVSRFTDDDVREQISIALRGGLPD
ncbi:hypothetical protein [Rhodococcus aetherivorans]|uniref:hypothetical protein n=1 Tax=Rhodococcus aetherivorans TaxID=191292 RepID=UPI00163B4F47|nr:hypothetical protein [Rhodococcus aetherivorans]MBC2589691.1 hypothetical protein [Rhodococcus aetherivorans]